MNQRQVEKVYSFYSRFYDVMFGKVLEEGRKKIFRTGQIRSNSRVLEIGIGTGLTLKRYPASCTVHGIDISAKMLQKSKMRAMRLRHRGQAVSLSVADAARLPCKNESFDVVVASYVLTTVENPKQVLLEMIRVLKKGGCILVLNHFLAERKMVQQIEKMISPVCKKIGFRTDLDLSHLMQIEGIQKEKELIVKPFRLYKIVQLRKELSYRC